MKRLILTSFVELLCSTHQVKAQWTVTDSSSLVQNIRSAVQGLTTTTNMVKSLQESIKIYNQSKTYYDALKSVHNIIEDAWKMELTLEMVSEITETYTSGFNRMVSDPNFTVDELAVISADCARPLEEGGALVTELKMVITGGNGLSLSDRGWIDMVDQAYTKILEYRNLTHYYTRKIISVSFVRSREEGDARRVLALYGNLNDKYW